MAFLVAGSVAVPLGASSVSAAPKSKATSFTVRATMQGAAGRTVVLMSKSGRVLASRKVAGNKRAVSLKTPKITSLAGASLHLVGASGDYFGPVVLNWNGTKSARATRVSTTFGKTATTVSLGAVVVTAKSANQGAGIAAKKFSRSARATVRATGGVPVGVGTYGKSQVAGLGVEAFAVSYNQNNVAPGADADSDGIVNAFDVNDDNDTKLDFQDNDTKPAANAAGNDCAAAQTFSIFSNFKATDPNFAGTINAYGTGSNEATNTRIATALTSTLTFAIQRVTGTVCGGTVTKNEFRGVDVPYAPNAFVPLPSGGMDVQWAVGGGKMNNASVAGLVGYSFTCASTCEISGQDTFIQRVTTTNGVYDFIANPTFVFVTHPMVTSIGGSPVNYASTPLGSQANPAPVSSSGTVTLEIYRPQRLAIEGEAGSFYDIGALGYFPDAPNGIDPDGFNFPTPAAPLGSGRCDAAGQPDTALAADSQVNTGAPAVLTLTWDMAKLGQCFAAKGASWGPGFVGIDMQVVAPVQNSGNAAQKIYFWLDPPT